MDHAVVFADCPTDSHWRNLPDAEKRAWAVRLVERALAQLDAEGRQPDGWESDDLGAALGSIMCKRFSAATMLVWRALTPVEGRSPLATMAEHAPLTVSDLRKGLDYVSMMPN